MSFYKNLSQVYEYVFPVRAPAVAMLKQLIGSSQGRVLDIACGTGGYAAALADAGHEVFACDLDQDMVEIAGKKSGVKAFAADMRLIASNPHIEGLAGSFDLIYCIGNSLVHLKNEKEIDDAVASMSELLRPGGHLLIQIINYERVLNGRLDGLPTIEVPEAGIRFERYYHYPVSDDRIVFQTVLKTGIDSTDYQESEGKVRLFPLLPERLSRILSQHEVTNIESYGNFAGDRFVPDKSVPFIISGVKKNATN